MHTKTPEEQSTDASSLFDSPRYHAMWNILNFTTVAMVTTASVILVQSPIKTIILGLSKDNSFPSFNGGLLSWGRVLYSGTQASLSGSALRTAYVTGAKSNKPNEKESLAVEKLMSEEREQTSNPQPLLAYVPIAALGETMISQIPNAFADHKKAGILPSDFKWYTPHNLLQLMKGNLGVKYSSALMNFYSLCILEQYYANRLAFIEPSWCHFIAGGLSGITAAIGNYPLAAFIDYTQVRARVEQGRLINKGVINSLVELFAFFRADPKATTKILVKNATRQLPLRMFSTAAIFSIISGTSELLGSEPLKKVIPQYAPSPRAMPTFFKPSTPLDAASSSHQPPLR